MPTADTVDLGRRALVQFTVYVHTDSLLCMMVNTIPCGMQLRVGAKSSQDIVTEHSTQ